MDGFEGPGRELPQKPVVHFESLSLSLLHQQAWVDGRQFALTPKEMALLYAFLRQTEKLISRGALYEVIDTVSDRALESQVYRLRKKLEGCGYTIVTVRGRGYRLERTDRF